jgi:hypothetical protein
MKNVTRRSFVSSAAAGVTTLGLFSVWPSLPRHSLSGMHRIGSWRTFRKLSVILHESSRCGTSSRSAMESS